MEKQELEKRFTYRAPKDDQAQRYDTIYKRALNFAKLINQMCPESREKSLALTKFEEAVEWARKSIERNE